MPVQAGTAYIKIEPDFTAFRAEVHREIKLKPVTQEVKVGVDQFSLRNAGKQIADHSKIYEGLKSTVVGTTAALVGGGGLVEALVESAKAGAAQETAAARLGKAVTNAGLSWKGHREEVEKWIESTARAKGFMDTDLSNAYANMIRTTGSVTEAQTLLNDAMDISRTKGVDLSSAQSLLARVYNGSYMGLKRLGIAITPVTTAQEALKTATAHLNAEQQHQIDLIRESNMSSDEKKKAIDKIKESTSSATDVEKAHAKALDTSATRTEALRLIQQKFGGQAATYARTTSGHYARLKVSLDQVEETIGKALLPTLDHLATKGVKAAGDFQKHWPQIKQDIKDVIDPIKTVTGWVVNFAKANPDLAKAAISFGLIAGAAVKLKDSALGRGVSALLNLTKLTGVKLPGVGGGAAGPTTATMRVGVMEVGEMVVGKGVGGVGGAGGVGGLGGGAVSTAEAEAETAATTGLRGKVAGALKGALGRAGTGLAIAGFGTVLSQAVGGAIHGGTGKAVSKIGTDMSVGAGLGLILGPEGALAGGVAGALVGGVDTFVKDHEEEASKKFAEALAKGVPDAIANAVRDAAQKASDQRNKALPPHMGTGARASDIQPTGTQPGASPGRGPPGIPGRRCQQGGLEPVVQRGFTFGKQSAEAAQKGYDACQVQDAADAHRLAR